MTTASELAIGIDPGVPICNACGHECGCPPPSSPLSPEMREILAEARELVEPIARAKLAREQRFAALDELERQRLALQVRKLELEVKALEGSNPPPPGHRFRGFGT